jgi:hypothetical protein
MAAALKRRRYSFGTCVESLLERQHQYRLRHDWQIPAVVADTARASREVASD